MADATIQSAIQVLVRRYRFERPIYITRPPRCRSSRTSKGDSSPSGRAPGSRTTARPENLPVAERVAKRILCLPLYGTLEAQAVENVCTIISELRDAR